MWVLETHVLVHLKSQHGRPHKEACLPVWPCLPSLRIEIIKKKKKNWDHQSQPNFQLNEPTWSEMKSLSRFWLFATPWTVAYQNPPSMGFSRQEYWSGLPFPSPGDLPDPGIEPPSPALQADAFPSEPPGKSWWISLVSEPEWNKQKWMRSTLWWLRLATEFRGVLSTKKANFNVTQASAPCTLNTIKICPVHKLTIPFLSSVSTCSTTAYSRRSLLTTLY